jgi:hypothetical protein
MNYRNAKLLKLADGAPCMMCSMQDGTVVAAHLINSEMAKAQELNLTIIA